MEFTKLETAALAWFATFYAEELPLLAEQLKRVRPTARVNTGNGFFTDLAIDDRAPRLELPSPLDGVRVRFEGMVEGLELLLFFKDGGAYLLEGYAIAGEDTSSIDIETAPFSDLSPLWPKRKDLHG